MKHSLYFFSQDLTPRHRYIINLLTQRWGLAIETYQDWATFKSLENVGKINYSHAEDAGSINIKPHGLLSQKNIEKLDLLGVEKDGLAFIFFLLSRYEEYVTHERDTHQRFSAKSSYLYQTNRLQKPVVDVLLNTLSQKLIDKFPFLSIKNQQFRTLLTIDIDQAFCYSYKPLKRFLGGMARDVYRFNFKTLLDRNNSYLKLKKDPWNIYEFLCKEAKHKKEAPIFFFLVGDYSAFNKNLPHHNKAFVQVIKSVEAWTTVGLHPSYNTAKDFSKMALEKHRLEQILEKRVYASRQHYIQLSLPQTYTNLIKAGISKDYSMGFADDIGFRAGTSIPFTWYNLEKEEPTALWVHPFCAMDVTLKNYKQYSISQAKQHLDNLKKEVEKVQGEFCLLVHNESLSNYKQWKGWGELLLKYWE